MIPESNNIDEYLKATDIIDWKHPEVFARSKELTEGLSGDMEKAKCLFEWVRDEIPHSKDISSEVITCAASEVLKEETGICYAKSHLLAALCRANNIPAGFCYQVLKRDPPYEGHVLHGLNGIYISEVDRWVRVDARGNTGNRNGQFSVEREQLAYPMDREEGEFIYEAIFVDPAPVLIEILNWFDSRSEMWPFLPASLDAEM